MMIRFFTVLLFVGFGFFTSCNNDDDSVPELEFESTAIISGFDMTLCACCGGWIINIDAKESDNRFTNLPKDSNIDLENVVFPISVKLNWSDSNEYCGKGIVVESIELTK